MEIANEHSWSTGKKIAFRFFFVLFFLFIVLENNGAYPFWQIIFYYPQKWLHYFIPWVGKNILHLSYEVTVFTNGSGDTTYDWIILFAILVLALIGTSIWSLFDRRRNDYKVLFYWLTVAIRYYVGLMLIQYGLFKIIKTQFPFPSLARLQETYGESSPMGLAWTFLGFSTGYNLFMGIAEVAAVLLLFRRTMTLGAIITLMTTANIIAVNYFYDVPVKIVSTFLVMMTLFLLSYNAEELIRFFFTRQPVVLPVIEAPPMSNKIKLGRTVFKSLLIACVLCFAAYEILKSHSPDMARRMHEPPLFGEYKVESFVKGKDTITLLTTDSARWRELKIETKDFGSVIMIDDSLHYFSINADTRTNVLYMTQTNGKDRFEFKFARPDSAHLLLRGVLKNDSLRILLRKRDTKNFQLMNRGFHWISEYPYNR